MAVCPYLLGKWRGYDPDTKAMFEVRGFRLIDHISACARMCRFLMRDTEFGRRLFYLMDLSARSGVTYEEFTNLALVATICHDLGKANSQFQEMLWQMERYYLQHGVKPPATAPRFRQAYRHEIVSLALLTQHPQIRDWLQKVCPRHSELVAFAAYGHHIKTHRQFPQGQHSSGPVFLSQLTPDLSELTKQMGLEPFPICADTKTSVSELDQLHMDLLVQHPEEESPLSAAIKWMVIISDTLGSFTPENEARLGTYEGCLENLLGDLTQAPQPYSYRTRCIQPLATDGTIKTPHEFQVELSKLNPHLTVLLDVGCGRGKTDGSYLWADETLRLILSTPTTGTATQLYLDHENSESVNRHSRHRVDQALKGVTLASNGPDSEESTDLNMEEILEELKGFDKQITYCTSDQILGLLSFSRRSVLWLLYLVQAQIVFDEFHDYDPVMSSWFKRFLDWFPNLRVLAMSASVTPAKRAVLSVRKDLTHVQDTGTDIPSDWPRYRVHLLGSRDEALKLFQPGTLWVVNRISVAQEVGQAFPQSLVYHSHFRYQDRVSIHEKFVAGYREEKKTIMGVATQVAEMSLDISATRMICEVCPPSAIVQRLGRLMRYLKKGGPVGDVYFYMPENGHPYHPSGSLDQFRVWEQWLQTLMGRDLSQRDLAAALSQYNPVEKVTRTDFQACETERRPLRLNQTATLGVFRSDVVAGNLHRAPMVEIQKVEIPVHLNPKEMAALSAAGAICRYRYVLDYNYDPRLGLLKK